MADKTMVDGPLKIAVRCDRDAGVIRAFFAPTDGTGTGREIAQMDIELVDLNRRLFGAWVVWLTTLAEAVYADAGVPVAGHDRRPAHTPEHN